jgi:hypothetical protein
MEMGKDHSLENVGNGRMTVKKNQWENDCDCDSEEESETKFG